MNSEQTKRPETLKMVGFDTVMRGVEKALASFAPELPAIGEHIAWVMIDRGACTDGLSALHRVGAPKKGAPYTTCDMPIPDPVRWLSLSPALIASALQAPEDAVFKGCGFCEARMAEIGRVAA